MILLSFPIKVEYPDKYLLERVGEVGKLIEVYDEHEYPYEIEFSDGETLQFKIEELRNVHYDN